MIFFRWVLINGLEKHAGNQACRWKRECEKSKWGQQLSPGDRFKACEKIPKPRTLYCHNPNYGEKSTQHIYFIATYLRLKIVLPSFFYESFNNYAIKKSQQIVCVICTLVFLRFIPLFCIAYFHFITHCSKMLEKRKCSLTTNFSATTCHEV